MPTSLPEHCQYFATAGPPKNSMKLKRQWFEFIPPSFQTLKLSIWAGSRSRTRSTHGGLSMDYITVGRRRGRPSESDDPPVGHPHLRLVSHLGEPQRAAHNSTSRSPASSLLWSAARTSQWRLGRLRLISKHSIGAFPGYPYGRSDCGMGRAQDVHRIGYSGNGEGGNASSTSELLGCREGRSSRSIFCHLWTNYCHGLKWLTPA